MKMRLWGTQAEIDDALERIRQAFNVVYQSEPYALRGGNSQTVRVYLEVRL